MEFDDVVVHMKENGMFYLHVYCEPHSWNIGNITEGENVCKGGQIDMDQDQQKICGCHILENFGPTICDDIQFLMFITWGYGVCQIFIAVDRHIRTCV